MVSKSILPCVKKAFWCVTIFAYFFQFPFPVLSHLIVPCVLGYIVLSFWRIEILKNRVYIVGLALLGTVLVFSVVISLIKAVAITRILRFLGILVLIPAVFCIRDDDFNEKKEIFIKLALIKSIVLIFFAALVIYYGDFNWLRSWVFKYNLGDIYYLNRLFPKVQVHGNALLLISFILDYTTSKKFTLRNVILLLGVLCAGNFAFVLALMVFFGWKVMWIVVDFIKENPRLKKWTLTGAALASLVVALYFWVKIKEKSTVSNAVRLEQLFMFLDENIIFGNGLGSWIEHHSNLVHYSGDIYFELQTLYIVNQIGLIGIAMFYTVTLLPMYFSGKKRLFLYLVYLLFSFWNPYCFDSTQLITIILIMNTAELGDYNEKSDYYRLLPFSKCCKKYSQYI